ncbi:MAG: hypothetical protein DRJ26_04105, partial [Candidatus Methanomethylicota archaeon]
MLMTRYVKVICRFAFIMAVILLLINLAQPALSQVYSKDITIIIRVYPNREIGLKIEGSVETERFEGVTDLAAKIHSYTTNTGVESDISLNVTFDFQVALQLPNVELQITYSNYTGKGTFSLEQTILGAGALTVNGNFTSTYDKDTEVTTIVFDAILVVPYIMWSKPEIQKF